MPRVPAGRENRYPLPDLQPAGHYAYPYLLPIVITNEQINCSSI